MPRSAPFLVVLLAAVGLTPPSSTAADDTKPAAPAAADAAVARGLAWLARQQKADGSWVFDGGGGSHEVAAATGLALRPFLAAGHTHAAGPYQHVVKAGLNFLIRDQQPDGRFGRASMMYGHAFAALALCEAYGRTKDKDLLLGPCQRATDYLIQAQGPDGGWRYQPRMHGDTSVTGWVVQVLHAAREAKDLVLPNQSLAAVGKYLDAVGGGGDAKPFYGYVRGSPPRPGTAMTAAGLLGRHTLGNWGPKTPGFAAGALSLLGDPLPEPKPGEPATDRRRAPKTRDQLPAAPDSPPDLYHAYYATRVLHALGGEAWAEWNEGPIVGGKRAGGMRDWLLRSQVTAVGPDLGSWNPDAKYFRTSGRRLATTCFCLLTLDVCGRPPGAKAP